MFKHSLALSILFVAFMTLPAPAQSARKAQVATRIPNLAAARLSTMSRIRGPVGRNNLPSTHLDSFVLNAGGYADQIYGGDCADCSPPAFKNFTQNHRINAGIRGERSQGLTTGHGSYLPNAWGGDEFVDGPEFSRSATESRAIILNTAEEIEARQTDETIGSVNSNPTYPNGYAPQTPNTMYPSNTLPPYPTDGGLYKANIQGGRFVGWTRVSQ